LPILHEYKLVKTRLGQSIIGIGAADDLMEMFLLLAASVLVGTQAGDNLPIILISLAVLILLTIGFRFFGKERQRFGFARIETLFLFILFVFFLFVGIGEYAAAAPLAAILAGVSVRLFIHDERLQFVEKELKSLTYGLFAPLFFVWIGLELDIEYLVSFPMLILLVVVVSKGVKMLASYVMGRNELGARGSILLGIGLSIRFSTSIIIIKFLFDNGIVGYDIYSVVVASSIVFKFVVPILFHWLIVKWKHVIT
jgi:Kef-type K+ transport system membrane component KefB